MCPPTTYFLKNIQQPNDDIIPAHYNQLKPHRTFPSNNPASHDEPPPASCQYEVPAVGGAGYPIPSWGTEDSAHTGRGQ
ncbi:unnamed protein product, partial [Trichobilharzia regenti]